MKTNDFVEISPISSFFTCFILSLLFVLLLYIWPKISSGKLLILNRNDPIVIKTRIISTLTASIIATIIIGILTNKNQNLSNLIFDWNWNSIIRPVIITILLFSGPIGTYFFEPNNYYHSDFKNYFKTKFYLLKYDESYRWQSIRNLLFAPIIEEYYFRFCLLTILECSNPPFSFSMRLFLSPFFFGICHIHHLIQLIYYHQLPVTVAIIQTLLQLIYTTLFGGFVAFIYLKSKCLISCILIHMFCNWMGVPDVSELFQRRQMTKFNQAICRIVYCIGIAMFTLSIYYHNVVLNDQVLQA